MLASNVHLSFPSFPSRRTVWLERQETDEPAALVVTIDDWGCLRAQGLLYLIQFHGLPVGHFI